MEQKTKTIINNVVTLNTLDRKWILVFSFDAAERNRDKYKEDNLKNEDSENYTHMLSKLWDITGISKETYNYDELIKYGRD